jgi:glycosyltransferase involved in cell wall biosynthesis
MSVSNRARPPFTVAIPTIGRTEFLPTLLSSLKAQTFGDFEALILDNASPPEAQAIYADWAASDSRFRVLRSDERLPMFTNFNRGYTGGGGKYLAFFHDDDVYLPRFLECHHAFLERHPDVAFTGSNNDYIDRDGAITERRRWISRTEVWEGKRYIRFVMERGRNLVGTPGVVYRMSALAPRGIDDRLSCHYGDFVVHMRLVETSNVGLLADVLVQLRRHDEQFSVKSWNMSKNFVVRAQVLRDYLTELRDRLVDDPDFVDAMDRAVTRSIRVGGVWGWMNAHDDADADACLDALRGSVTDETLRVLLRRIDGLGVDSRIRRTYLAPFVRRVGNALRV